MDKANIADIRKSVQKGVYESCPVGVLAVDAGLVGDAAAKPGSRQLSMLMGEREAQIRAANGLCTARFNANLVTVGLDYARLSPGCKLRAGEGENACELEITAVGKRCFPEDCALRKRGEMCLLPVSTAFAKVLKGGEIRAGDGLTLL